MIKTVLKVLLAIIIYTIVFILANVLMPFSPGFKEMGASSDPMGIIFILVNSVWVIFTLYFIIRHAGFRGRKLFFSLFGVMFFILSFMTQIETLLFIEAFPMLIRLDAVLIMLTGLFPLSAAIALLIKFFSKADTIISDKVEIKLKNVLLKLGCIGIIYLCIYMLFGYFIAWQFEELRVFYSGSPVKLGFFQQVFSNSPGMISFQVLRGILFGLFIIPIRLMITKSKIAFIIGVCLVYSCTAIMLIIPNVLFPDIVRHAHFLEMISSMLLFGIIVGNFLWWTQKR